MSTRRGDLQRRPRSTVAVLRLGVAALIVAAVVATVAEAASRTTINPFNLFGYFTIQSNLILAVVVSISGWLALTGRPTTDWVVRARAASVTYIAVVGIVYAVLLAPLGAAGGVPVVWANLVLHVITPIFGILDWLFAPDRHPLPYLRTIGLILLYPLAWSAVVLIRGATDGWVPYPFLDPASGYGRVALYVLLIAVTITVVAALVVAITRLPSTKRGASRSRSIVPTPRP